MSNQPEDPFAGGQSVPSVSFKDAPVGTAYTGTVTDTPKLVQSRDFETGNPATWPDGNPKMSAVVNLVINGEERSLWAAKPSAMFAAVKEAQERAGAKITPGGTLTITYIGDKPNDNPRLNAAKQYRVDYKPGDAFGDNAPAVPGVANPTNAEMLDAWAGNSTATAPPSATLPQAQPAVQRPAGIPEAAWNGMTDEAKAAVANLTPQG